MYALYVRRHLTDTIQHTRRARRQSSLRRVVLWTFRCGFPFPSPPAAPLTRSFAGTPVTKHRARLTIRTCRRSNAPPYVAQAETVDPRVRLSHASVHKCSCRISLYWKSAGDRSFVR
jgi:hypothetical protein